VTRRLPHAALSGLCRLLDLPLAAYVGLCRRVRLPLWRYCRNHLGRCSPAVRRLTIYDQLNPAWARYYTGAQARRLLEDAGFERVRLHHRHGYSWTVLGEKGRGCPQTGEKEPRPGRVPGAGCAAERP
jgi:hypothetical protein